MADETYSERIGRKALDEFGKKAWRKRVRKAVPPLQRAFLADYVVLGGGNAKQHLKEPLPPGVRLGHNLAASRGGFRLWGIDVPTQVNGHRTTGAAVQGEWRLL